MQKEYISPEVEILDVVSEGVLCASNETMEENKNNAIEKAEKVMRENTSNIEREKSLADKRINLAQKKCQLLLLSRQLFCRLCLFMQF